MREQLVRFTPVAPERLTGPYFQNAAPCSLLIDEIEGLWSAIDRQDDWTPFARKVAAIREMGAALRLA